MCIYTIGAVCCSCKALKCCGKRQTVIQEKIWAAVTLKSSQYAALHSYSVVRVALSSPGLRLQFKTAPPAAFTCIPSELTRSPSHGCCYQLLVFALTSDWGQKSLFYVPCLRSQHFNEDATTEQPVRAGLCILIFSHIRWQNVCVLTLSH